jgi:hypothetical protein
VLAAACALLVACDKHHTLAYWAALTARANAPCECAKLGQTIDAYHLREEVARALIQCRAKAEALTVPDESPARLGGNIAPADLAREAALQEEHTKCESRWSQALRQADPQHGP